MGTPTPSGWYDDPSAPGTERWWDGGQWTGSSRTKDGTPGVPPPPGHAPPSAARPKPGDRNRTILFSVIALALVGGLIAALLTVFGDDGGGGPATSGRIEDPEQGVSIPRFKGWTQVDPEDNPTLQGSQVIPCPKESEESADPSEEPEPTPTESVDPAEQCYRISVGTISRRGKGKDFPTLVKEMRDDLTKDDDKDDEYDFAKVEVDKDTTVDGLPAHIIRTRHTLRAGAPKNLPSGLTRMYVLIKPRSGENYPAVVAEVTDGADKSVMDTLLKNTKVTTPAPSATASDDE